MGLLSPVFWYIAVIRVTKFFTKTRETKETAYHGCAPFWYGLWGLYVFVIKLVRCVKSAKQQASSQNLLYSQHVYLVYERHL